MHFYLPSILYWIVLLLIFMLPLHIAGQNKKKSEVMFWIRVTGLCFGWTIIGYLIALYLATKPK